MEATSIHKHEQEFCQSCGMPMPEADLRGSEANGAKSEDYCTYCYENGAFKQPEITLQEMIDLCAGYLVEDGMDEAAARQLLSSSIPHLKRWRTPVEAE